uniref:Uncharacterized protein n=1 Tax=Timema tahoe TaxID=61484 RepID=A0A7R9FMM9_9NEOP|nr:unnamed protein product [Timema tahoe]
MTGRSGFEFLSRYNDPAAPSERRPLSKSERRTDRTTKMLVAVLLLFFITEFPQGKNLVLPAQNVFVTLLEIRTLFHLFRMCDTFQGKNFVPPSQNVFVILLEIRTLFHLLRIMSYNPQGKNLVLSAQNVLYYSREETCFTCSECDTIRKERTLSSYLLRMFGEVMDMLALLNGAINFILYCSMSRQFRTTFGQLFKPRSMLAKWATPSQTEAQSTYV